MALSCALLLATADALTKAKLSHLAAPELTIVRFSATALILSPLLPSFPFSSVPGAFWGWLLVLVPLELTANVLYMSAISSAPLALTLPYLAFRPALVLIPSTLFLGERVSFLGLLGIGLVVVGAVLLNAQAARQRDGAPDFERGRFPKVLLEAIARNRGSQKMLGTAAIYAITSAVGKHLLTYVSGYHFAALYYAAAASIALLVFGTFGRARPRELVESLGWKLTLGVLMAGMILTHFTGLGLVEVAYFISVKRTSLLFGIVYGALLFQERGVVRHMAAGLAMVAGTTLIALAG